MLEGGEVIMQKKKKKLIMPAFLHITVISLPRSNNLLYL